LIINYLRALAARFRGLFRDSGSDRELDEEIETHLRLLTERYVRQGMTEAEAVRAARAGGGEAKRTGRPHGSRRRTLASDATIHR